MSKSCSLASSCRSRCHSRRERLSNLGPAGPGGAAAGDKGIRNAWVVHPVGCTPLGSQGCSTRTRGSPQTGSQSGTGPLWRVGTSATGCIHSSGLSCTRTAPLSKRHSRRASHRRLGLDRCILLPPPIQTRGPPSHRSLCYSTVCTLNHGGPVASGKAGRHHALSSSLSW